MEMSGTTTIQLSVETREKLKGLGKKGETYDDVIIRLIESVSTSSTEEV